MANSDSQPPRKPGEDAQTYAQRIAAQATPKRLRMSPVKDPDERDIITLQNKAANDPALQKYNSYIDIGQGGQRARVYSNPNAVRGR